MKKTGSLFLKKVIKNNLCILNPVRSVGAVVRFSEQGHTIEVILPVVAGLVQISKGTPN